MSRPEKTQSKQKSVELAAFRLPSELKDEACAHCHKEDITFSQLMRRAIRKELAGVKEEVVK